jgi:hypothetical protein
VQPWYSCQFGFGGFGGFHYHRHCHYDPLLVFYSGYHRRHHHIDYHDRLHRWHRHYHDHEDFRPRRTVREQDEFIARHEHGDEREREIVKNARLSRKLDEYAAQPSGNDQHFVKLDEAERDRRGKKSKEITDFADLRRDAEVGDTVVRNDRNNGSRDRNNDRTGTDNVTDVTIPDGTGDNPASGADDNSRKSRKLRLPEVERNADRTRDARNVTGAPVEPPGGSNSSDSASDDRSRVPRRSNNNRNNAADGTPTVDSGTPESVQPDRTTRDSRNRPSREFDSNSGNGNRGSRQNQNQSGNNTVPEIVPGTSQPGSSGSNDNSGSNRNTRRQQRDTSSGPSYQPDSGNVPRSNNSNDGSRNRSNRSGNDNQSNSGSFNSNQGSSNSNRSFDSSRNSNRNSNNGSFNSGSRSNQSPNNGSFNSGSRPSNQSSNSGTSNQSNRSSNSGSRSGSSRKRDR